MQILAEKIFKEERGSMRKNLKEARQKASMTQKVIVLLMHQYSLILSFVDHE